MELKLVNLPIINIEKVIDTVQLARQTIPGAAASLDALCKRFDIDLSQRGKHGALLDAQLLAEVYLELTGGRQVSLALNQSAKNMDLSKNNVKIEGKDLNYVVAVLTKEEDEQHLKMLQKIKEPIWLK